MGLLDGFIVVGIFIVLGYILFLKLSKRHPQIKEQLEMLNQTTIGEEKVTERVEQVYDEKRAMI